MAAQRLDDLFDELGVDLRLMGKKYMGSCPVHGGTMRDHCMLYPDGYEVKGNWVCWSEHCEREFSRSLIGFVRGVLSHQRLDYNGEDKLDKVSTKDAVFFLLKFLGITIDQVKVDYERIERMELIREVEQITGPKKTKKEKFNKARLSKILATPSPYFIGRGFLPETLIKFEVGTCVDLEHELFGRAVVPVYNDEGLGVGLIGRATCDRCRKCRMFHTQDLPCPPKSLKGKYAKWRVYNHFNDKVYLYNFYRAAKYIKSSKTVVVCEGPGDVWRLDEAGIRNAVAVFGNEVNYEQMFNAIILGLDNVVLAADMDDSGKKLISTAMINVRPHVKDIYRIKLPKKDVGEMTVEEVKELFIPYLESL